MSSLETAALALALQAAAFLASKAAMLRLEHRAAVAELRRDYPRFVGLARIFGQMSSSRPLSDAESVRRWITVSQEAWEDTYADPRLKRLVRKVVGDG